MYEYTFTNKIIGILQEALATNVCEKQNSKSSIVIEYVGYTEDRIEELDDLIITMQAQAVAEAEGISRVGASFVPRALTTREASSNAVFLYN